MTYAVILAPASVNHLHECGPARVMQIERTTATRAYGYILNRRGQHADRNDGYDIRPMLPQDNGAVKLYRIVASFPTFDEALEALGRMQDAWRDVDDPRAEAADNQRRDMNAEYWRRQMLFQEEMEERMKPFVEARDIAKAAHERAINDLFAARLAAAKAVASGIEAPSGRQDAPAA